MRSSTLDSYRDIGSNVEMTATWKGTVIASGEVVSHPMTWEPFRRVIAFDTFWKDISVTDEHVTGPNDPHLLEMPSGLNVEKAR